MKKRTFYCEIAYVMGLLMVALGVTLTGRASFGYSMIVSPAYLLHRWLSPTWSFFTFGTAEYCFQALLIIILSVVMGKMRISYLLSFVTAVIYGFILDGLMLLGAHLPAEALWQRIIWFVLGVNSTACGVAWMFHTYLSPEAYDLFVKEVSGRFGFRITRFKTAYDMTSCLLAIIMSFLIFGFGKFVGVSWGTVVIALINGTLIGRYCALYEKLFSFKDAFGLRPFFTGEEKLK